jgi:YegS/Rv2252/BmrU family lipid kinase
LKIFLLCNPVADGGNANKQFGRIKEVLEKRKIDFDIVSTNYAGEAVEIIKILEFAKYDAISICGGDGTLFETINGYMQNQSPIKIPVSVFPVGRGNAFARDIGLEAGKIEEAADLIINNKTKLVDIGFCKTQSKSFYFINILGLGFVTDVAATAFKLRAFGHLSYILGVLYRTISLKSFPLSIEIDGKLIKRDNVFVEISNTRYTGKDFLMAPNALIDDGFLDITLMNKMSRLRLLQCLPKIFDGSHLSMKEVETFRAKNIKITTIPQKGLTPDGQLTGETPIEIDCLHKKIPFLVK